MGPNISAYSNKTDCTGVGSLSWKKKEQASQVAAAFFERFGNKFFLWKMLSDSRGKKSNLMVSKLCASIL